MDAADLSDRLTGTLLGTALGDALGLPAEGLSSRSVARRFGKVDRFRLLGRTGFVSDDTEQAALIAQCLASHPDDVARCAGVSTRVAGMVLSIPLGHRSSDDSRMLENRSRHRAKRSKVGGKRLVDEGCDDRCFLL